MKHTKRQVPAFVSDVSHPDLRFFSLYYSLANQLISEGVVAIIGPKTSAAVKAIYPVCSKFNIPLISASATDPSLVHKNNEYLLRMSPPDTKMSHALVKLIKKYKWNRMGILTSNTDYGKKIPLRMLILILFCITVAWQWKEGMRFPV